MQKQEQVTNNDEYLDSLLCPSFNSYSTGQLAGIAAQVGRDYHKAQNDDAFTLRQNDDTDFEFVAFQEAADDGPFYNDAVFPLFNRDLLSSDTTASAPRRSERDPPTPRSESSDSDDSDVVPANCFGIPNSPPTLSGCRKSNSTGSWSSKRWKLLDLLRRSNSDGRESLGSLAPPSPVKNKAKEQWSMEVAGKSKAKGFSDGAGGGKKVPVSAHEALYVRNRELRRMDKKRSFLPYKPDLVGFCTRRLGKAFPSF